ncbi:MAG TPA: lysyl oxidase family protein [Pyrinomonadaceae bacterium]|jgi:hypothetical protein|nr:lysyl oxidase family protein [Pyrinomonadaceae bacterium]
MSKARLAILVVITLCVLIVPTALSKKTKVSRAFPVYDNGNKPDLTIDPQNFVARMEIVDRLFDETGCEFKEGAVHASGNRRIIRFETVILNSGDGDLVVGDRNDPNNQYAQAFAIAPCRGDYYIKDFSRYELLSLDRTVVLAEQKSGLYLEDSFKVNGGKSKSFDSASQGITSGWADSHNKQLAGQWIDITGIPEGDYIVRASINISNTFDEGTNRYTNAVETMIHVPDPRKHVKTDNSAE